MKTDNARLTASSTRMMYVGVAFVLASLILLACLPSTPEARQTLWYAVMLWVSTFLWLGGTALAVWAWWRG